MKKTFVLTMVGPDRPGIVNQLSNILTHHHANWLESRMANLAGEFAGILHASVDTDKYQALLRDLNKLQADNLHIVVKESDSDSSSNINYLTAELEVVGTDREGIIRDITATLSQFDINVEELATEFTEAPMSSTPLFKATATLTIPQPLDLDTVEQEIEKIANDLMTEFRIEP